MSSSAEVFSAKLLEIGALLLRPTAPFCWASGWHAPIYVDNRRTLAFPAVRTFVRDSLLALLDAHFPQATALAAVATGAIAQGALLADARSLPLCYVRSHAKDHGTGSLIEGTLPEGSKVVVVEDLISTGGSSLRVVAALRAAGYDVVGMVASYTYGFAVAEAAFAAANVPLYTISDYATTVAVAAAQGYITSSDLSLLAAWRDAPDTWDRQ